MKAFCEYNDHEIAGEYEDAGRSGKSIEGRIQFDRMLEDIKFGTMRSCFDFDNGRKNNLFSYKFKNRQ